jgi:competence protein ComEC
MRARGNNTGVEIAACALVLIAGAALQLQQAALWRASSYALIIGAALLVLAVALQWQRGAALIGLAALAFAFTGLRAQWRLADALPAALEGRDVVVTGVVAQLPRRLPEGVRFVFDVESALLQGQRVRVPSRIQLGWYGGWQEEVLMRAPYEQLAAGQRWRFVVRLKQPHGSVNPHGFDHELWMFEQGLRASGAVRATERESAQLLQTNAAAPIERLRQRVRDAIFARVPDARAAGVLAALAVGDQAAIERADWDVFRTTGIAHLVSISGLHVTMFAWLAAALIARMWRTSARAMLWRPAATAARWGGLAAATAYALLSGWGVPAQRTLWMLASAALLAHLGLRWPWPLVLLVVAAVVAAIDPWALLQPGFWLSFAAVGLLIVATPLEDTTPRGHAGSVWSAAALVRTLRSGLRTQAVATVGLAPLTLVFFQQVSLIGFVANLVAIPLITFVITPLALAGALAPPLWTLAAACVQGLTTVLQHLSALPAAVWTAAAAPWWMQAAALLGAALLVMRLPWPVRALALPLMLPLFAPPIVRPAEGAMLLTVADVGQGSAILVRTRAHALLHDTGAQYTPDSDAGSRVLVPLLRSFGVQRLDLLVLSHRDSDHVGGAAAVMSALDVAALSSSIEASHPLRALAKQHQRCEAGQSWQWDGVRFDVLHPQAADYERSDAKPNTLSCVLAVTDAQGRRVLLTGDLEAEQEARLAREQPVALKSDVLLVPHHGSKTSSSPAFLDAVAPRVALVQAGYRNRYGHPAPAVAARYAERSIAFIDTVGCGAWSTTGDSIDVCERERSRRYWHHGLEVAPIGSEINTRETVSWPSTSR